MRRFFEWWFGIDLLRFDLEKAEQRAEACRDNYNKSAGEKFVLHEEITRLKKKIEISQKEYKEHISEMYVDRFNMLDIRDEEIAFLNEKLKCIDNVLHPIDYSKVENTLPVLRCSNEDIAAEILEELKDVIDDLPIHEYLAHFDKKREDARRKRNSNG